MHFLSTLPLLLLLSLPAAARTLQIPLSSIRPHADFRGKPLPASNNWSVINGRLECSTPGVMCRFDFEGTAVSLHNVQGPAIDVSVDYSPYRRILNPSGTVNVASNLPPASHRVMLRLPDDSPASRKFQRPAFTRTNPAAKVSIGSVSARTHLPANRRVAFSMLTRDNQRLVCDYVNDVPSFKLVPNSSLPPSTPAPRPWRLFMIQSAHTDIGLHHSQYIQRQGTVLRTREAQALIDADPSPDSSPSAYRYVLEHDWFFRNYTLDQPARDTLNLLANHIARGRIGLGAGFAHNHTHVFGFEQLFRSAYTRRRLLDDFRLDVKSFMMIDNPGFSWSLIAPYAEAGFRYLLWAPNHWNPLLSQSQAVDMTVEGHCWNPDAGGGGARTVVDYSGRLPRVFRWLAPDGTNSILTFTSTQYDRGFAAFGLNPFTAAPTPDIERLTAQSLRTLESLCPYDMFISANYCDDQRPSTNNAAFCAQWNAKWQIPTFSTVGDMDPVFEEFERRFGPQIPTLSGEMTSGWLQHCTCAPELLAQKIRADRALPAAESLAVLSGAPVPKTELDRAYAHLTLNDEHSYGTSEYKGRDVVETWVQHRDWIDKAESAAAAVSSSAVLALAQKSGVRGRFFFNPTSRPKQEPVTIRRKGKSVKVLSPLVPAWGWASAPDSSLPDLPERDLPLGEPVLENEHYRLRLAPDGTIASIFDRSLNRELLDPSSPHRANQILYTRNNHLSFLSPTPSSISRRLSAHGEQLVVSSSLPELEADITQTITLSSTRKLITLKTSFKHCRDLFRFRERYLRYGYIAFPFLVPDASPVAQLNGPVVNPERDHTGHTIDAFTAVRDWSAVQNSSFGVALFQQDSLLCEFGKIHPDKTSFGDPLESSSIYAYVFTDWLQRQYASGDEISPEYSFAITSYSGSWQSADIPAIAESIHTPLAHAYVRGKPTPPASASLLALPLPNLALSSLKPADNSRGIIARFRETHGVASSFTPSFPFAPSAPFTRVSLDERPLSPSPSAPFTILPFSTATFRIDAPVEIAPPPHRLVPYTGLIDSPRAVHGEEDGEIFLLWGKNPLAKKYEIYRQQAPLSLPRKMPSPLAFLANAELAGTCENECHSGIPYVVARFADRNLLPATRYLYLIKTILPDSTEILSPIIPATTRKNNP